MAPGLGEARKPIKARRDFLGHDEPLILVGDNHCLGVMRVIGIAGVKNLGGSRRGTPACGFLPRDKS